MTTAKQRDDDRDPERAFCKKYRAEIIQASVAIFASGREKSLSDSIEMATTIVRRVVNLGEK